MRREPLTRRFLILLGVMMVVGLAIRLWFVLHRQAGAEIGAGDAFWYHFQAKLVASGKGFLHPFDYYKEGISAPGADHPPGFVVILAGLDVLGLHSPQAQRLVMAFVGTGSIALVGFLGRMIVSERVGLIAAGIAAIYPNFWINDGMLMVETMFIMATIIMLIGTYRYMRTRALGDAVVVSVAVTAATMVRPEAALLFVILVTPLVVAGWRRGPRRALGHLAVAALIPVLAFAPWVVYNLGRFDTPVLISTGAGQTLAVGNCDLTYSGTYIGYYKTECLLEPYIAPPPRDDRSVADGMYRSIAVDYMKSHAGELPKVVAARIGRQWQVFRPGQSLGLDGFVEGRSGGPPGTGFETVREALWSYYVLAVLAIGGLVVLRRRRVPVLPLLAQPLLVTLVAAGTFGITRYRAGAEVSIVLAAAVALAAITEYLFPMVFTPLPTRWNRHDEPAGTGTGDRTEDGARTGFPESDVAPV